MDSRELSRLFEINAYCVRVNTEGLSEADSFVQPQGGGNCANWVLGHIVATRHSILKMLGKPPIWNETEVAIYKRGSAPIAGGGSAMQFTRIISDFEKTQEIMLGALKELPGTALSEKVGENTLSDQLATLHFHEAYHTGQLGLLRRIAGKEGAIK